MAQNVYYHATLCLHTPLVVAEDRKKGNIKVALSIGERQLSIIVKKKVGSYAC